MPHLRGPARPPNLLSSPVIRPHPRTPLSPMRSRIALVALASLLLGGCLIQVRREPPAPAADDGQIAALLQASTAEWNKGNLEGFLLPYADGPDVTFVGSTGLVRGKDAIRQKYVTSYFPQGGPLPGQLAYRDLEVRMLGSRNALVVGRYVVTDRNTGAQAATGIFSLNLEKRPEGWRIIHDHSS
jgi:uncharacterized protein (TIGR02246 family)